MRYAGVNTKTTLLINKIQFFHLDRLDLVSYKS